MTPIPITVIGGFLGAGKTTLLNHILRRSGARRIAVLVNDFGDINIDADLVAAHEGDTISLSNGCICCSIGESLAETLFRVTQRSPRPEQIVIEGSGVADPGPIAAMAEIDPALRLHGIVIVADATSIDETAADRYVGDTVLRQLKAADLVILNKADLASSAERARVAGWLREQAPGVPIVEAVEGTIPPELLIGLEPPALPARQRAGGLRFPHADAFVSTSFRSERPFRSDALRTALATMPSVIRAKGFALMEDEPRRPCTVQLVGRRLSLRWGEGWPSSAATRLVLIGVMGRMDTAVVTQRLEAALARDVVVESARAGSMD